MSGAAFLRVEKLKGGGIVTVAARHNKREIQAELGAAGSIDPARSSLNFSLAGSPTADGVAQLAKDLMTAASVGELRKDAVRAIEAVFSLPVNTRIDLAAYFADCLAWAAAYFGGLENILSFDVHLDEAAPHAHALVLPLVDGQMNGSDMVGARSKLLDMQSQFHQSVAKRYGLHKAPAKLKGEAKRRATGQVLAYLRETGDAVMQSAAWPTVRGCIENEPEPFLLALGLVPEPVKPIKPFVDYVTSTGRGPRREREQHPKAYIGFAPESVTPNPIVFEKQSLEKGEPYLCGGFTPSQRTKKPPPAPKPASPQTKPASEPETSTKPETDEGTLFCDGDQPGNPTTQQNSTSGTSATLPTVSSTLEVPPTECEMVYAADDDGEDF